MKRFRQLIIVSLLFCLSSATVPSQNKTVFCQSIGWSPDSKQICFAAILVDSGKIVKDHWQIYLVNVDGTNLRKLTSGNYNNEWPSFSPDGKKIAFESTRDGNPEIYVMNADGSGQTRITVH
ncbi:MAG: TolB family protein, partial [Chitinophagales bacterium]